MCSSSCHIRGLSKGFRRNLLERMCTLITPPASPHLTVVSHWRAEPKYLYAICKVMAFHSLTLRHLALPQGCPSGPQHFPSQVFTPCPDELSRDPAWSSLLNGACYCLVRGIVFMTLLLPKGHLTILTHQS